MILPFIVILLFGGRTTVITICLCSVIGYIVDLIGFVEGSFIVLMSTYAGVVATLMYAGRFILGESIWNFPFVVDLGLLLFFGLFAVFLQFRSVVTDMDTFAFAGQRLIISSLPCLAASVMTWYICVQLDGVDVGICYSFCYFLFAMYLTSSVGSRRQGLDFFVPPDFINLMEGACVVMGPLLYVALHHNIILVQPLVDTARSASLATAVPLFLMSVHADTVIKARMISKKRIMKQRSQSENNEEKEMSEKETEEAERKLERLVAGPLIHARWVQVIAAGVYIWCIQDHPYLSDIKSLCGVTAIGSSSLSLGMLAVLFAAVSYRMAKQRRYTVQEVEELGVVTNLPVAVSMAAATAFFCVVFGVPLFVLPACIGGVLLLSEYYLRPFDLSNEYHVYLATVSVLCAGLTAVVVALFFMQQTIWFLTFQLQSSFLGVSISVQQIANWFSMLCGIAIVLPAVIAKEFVTTDPSNATTKQLEEESALGYIPQSANAKIFSRSFVSQLLKGLIHIMPSRSLLFSIGISLFSIIVAFVELLIREQVRAPRLRKFVALTRRRIGAITI